MQVREAGAEDAAGIARAHVLSWQAAYRGLLPQDYLDGLDPVQRRSVWQRTLASQGGRETTLVAEEMGEVIGFAHLCPSRDDDAMSGSVGELASMYLLPETWGRGYGRQLMASAVPAFQQAEFSEATLWVLDANQRARQFYEAGGWRRDGAQRRQTLRGFVLDETRYRLALT